jgi:hypothetical protein
MAAFSAKRTELNIGAESICPFTEKFWLTIVAHGATILSSFPHESLHLDNT